MSALTEKFNQVGGAKLLWSWSKKGLLPYALTQLMITGFSQTSLEIVRLGVRLKIKSRLSKKYGKYLHYFDLEYDKEQMPYEQSNFVWICWFQGLESAPDIVCKCYESVKRNMIGKEVILLTDQNIKDYVYLPDYIWEKYDKGIITRTHFSDILRVALLSQRGGTWIDSTVYCSSSNVPAYMTDSDLFVFRNLKPGENGSVLNISTWFMTGCKNNRILMAVNKLLWEYWKERNSLYDYFLVHFFFAIVADRYKDEWERMQQYPNSTPHIMQLTFFQEYNSQKWEDTKSLCPFHKLSYKFPEDDKAKANTFYKHFISE